MEAWKKKLVRSLFPYSAARLKIEEGFRAKDPYVPARLFKYRTFSDNHLKALREGALWMSAPERFNDPYDTAIYFDTSRFMTEDCTADEFIASGTKRQEALAAGERWEAPRLERPISQREWQEKLHDELLRDEPPALRDALVSVIGEVQDQANKKMVENMSANLRKGFGVLSLTENAVSPLMWSHYSDSHKGFCVEYDLASLPYCDLRKRLCFPVFYRRKLTDATPYMRWNDPSNFNNLFPQFMCLLKSDEWSYEREWRLVESIGPSHANKKILMPKPSAIILGCQVDAKDRDLMREFCASAGIPLRQVRQQRDAFRFEVNDAE